MKKKLLIAIVVLAIIGSGGLYMTGYFSSSDELSDELSTETVEEAVDSHGNPIDNTVSHFLPLEPAFIVNFSHMGVLRYLQMSLVAKYPDESQLQKITDNMPEVRNALILLLSDQKFEKLNSPEGKEEIQAEMMVAINTIIHAEDDTGNIYFTNFVMQ